MGALHVSLLWPQFGSSLEFADISITLAPRFFPGFLTVFLPLEIQISI
jgi:hypothetical protein